MWRKLLLLLPAVLQASVSEAELAQKKFLNLPLGSVKPSGWLHDQLAVQTNGLAGHEHEFYRYISQTTWTGGDALYSNLEEAGSYWFNGMVPNAVLMDDENLRNKVQEFLDYVIDHQDSTGWLGPEVGTDKPRFLWGRYPFFLGAIQMMEAHPEQTDRIVTALYKFVDLANKMLHNDGEGVEEWARTRYGDFIILLQWLHDFHPNGREDFLIETMKLLHDHGDPWEKALSDEFFPKGATENLPNPFSPLMWHGVNVAQGLKALPAVYRFSRNQTELDIVSHGWDLIFQYHGRPSGIFAADEYLAGLDAHRGTELCLVVEMMFSGSYLYQVIGDPKFADRIERITYNALPATLTGDMWSRQYLQQQNQVASKNMDPNPFPRDGPYSNVFGLEPNYPCCTVNLPQGWPKFISNAFVVTPEKDALVHVYLGPFSTDTVLADDNAVSVNVDTQYPFSDTLTTTITAAKPFTYQVRIPAWATNGTIALGDGTAQPVSPSNGLHSVAVGAGTTKLTLSLPAEITTELRPHGAIAVQRGPLHYAFDIPRRETVLRRDGQEPRAVDLQMDPSEAWQYAIDPATLRFTPRAAPDALPSPVFDAGAPPFALTVRACPVAWGLAGDTFAQPPPESPACTGPERDITLTPYGATKLRISEFPTFRST